MGLELELVANEHAWEKPEAARAGLPITLGRTWVARGGRDGQHGERQCADRD